MSISTTEQQGLATDNPYRYAYGLGMLLGRIQSLELELKYGRPTDIHRKATELVEIAARIRQELDQKVTP